MAIVPLNLTGASQGMDGKEGMGLLLIVIVDHSIY
jgi:hypothetical protein